jgi:hypothetical protein
MGARRRRRWVREVHVNIIEGLWTNVRDFPRPFKGVHKWYLSGYVAMAKFRRNLKRRPIVHCSTACAHFL